MEVQVHLDGNPTIREEGFFESKVASLEAKIKSLEFDNAEDIILKGKVNGSNINRFYGQ